MIKKITRCKRCDLCQNQSPLLDKNTEKIDVMWVGLSAKQVKDKNHAYPLAPDTNSGKIILEIEELLPNITFYKTNIVKCLPLNDKNKIRYPSKIEIETCLPNLIKEIEILNPKVIILLGGLVSQFFYSYLKNNNSSLHNSKIVSVKHPSYIATYKRKNKNEYQKEICDLINNAV